MLITIILLLYVMPGKHTLHKHKMIENGVRQDTFNWSHDAANLIINGLMNFHNITKKDDKSFKTARGLSYVKTREITTPERFKTPYYFLVALHEIGHIICHDRRNSKPYKYNYMCEYDTEIFTIKCSKSLSFIPNDHLEYYIEDAKAYVLQCLIKDIRKYKLTESDVNKHVLKWIGIDFKTIISEMKPRGKL